MKLRIENHSMVGYKTRVWLDDKELDHVREVRLDLSHSDFNECVVTFTPTEIEVDAESLAVLRAIVEDDGGART